MNYNVFSLEQINITRSDFFVHFIPVLISLDFEATYVKQHISIIYPYSIRVGLTDDAITFNFYENELR